MAFGTQWDRVASRNDGLKIFSRSRAAEFILNSALVISKPGAFCFLLSICWTSCSRCTMFRCFSCCFFCHSITPAIFASFSTCRRIRSMCSFSRSFAAFRSCTWSARICLMVPLWARSLAWRAISSWPNARSMPCAFSKISAALSLGVLAGMKAAFFCLRRDFILISATASFWACSWRSSTCMCCSWRDSSSSAFFFLSSSRISFRESFASWTARRSSFAFILRSSRCCCSRARALRIWACCSSSSRRRAWASFSFWAFTCVNSRRRASASAASATFFCRFANSWSFTHCATFSASCLASRISISRCMAFNCCRYCTCASRACRCMSTFCRRFSSCCSVSSLKALTSVIASWAHTSMLASLESIWSAECGRRGGG
mmetsp:Transcript_19437/g.34489  ORF Transcript_19437/g.34489 Transcript_19437/m.34489 type:complete len:375 (+) Transcript_19437:341-1465(+)